jgi:hypothetical protein
MKDRLRPGSVILLDDLTRSAERDVLQRWVRELDANDFVVTTAGKEGVGRSFATLVVP